MDKTGGETETVTGSGTKIGGYSVFQTVYPKFPGNLSTLYQLSTGNAGKGRKKFSMFF